MKNSYTIHINEKSNDLIKSIDIISHKLAKTLRRYHNKLIDNYQKGSSSSSLDVIDSLPEFDEEELLKDLELLSEGSGRKRRRFRTSRFISRRRKATHRTFRRHKSFR